jgi:hypothetical protein
MSESGQDKSSTIDQLVEQRDRGPSAVSAAVLESLLEEDKGSKKNRKVLLDRPYYNFD